MNDVVELIERGAAQTGRVVDGIGDDQWSNPTLCPGWDVRGLLNHAVGACELFSQALSGPVEMPSPDEDRLGDDPKGTYHRASRAGVKAWQARGALDGTVKLPFGEIPRTMAAQIFCVEVITHGLDLAVATGQEDTVDQSLAEQAIDVARAMGADSFRIPRVFGPEVPVADDAPGHRKLLGYLGRAV